MPGAKPLTPAFRPINEVRFQLAAEETHETCSTANHVRDMDVPNAIVGTRYGSEYLRLALIPRPPR